MNEAHASAGAARKSLALPVCLIALVALILRSLEAWESSLWLDELHTLSHASQPTLRALIEHVQAEFHTPLFFGFVRVFGAFEAGAWLRAIPIVSSVLVLWPLLSIARECELSDRAALSMAWLYACLPYQVLYGSELRPYAWSGAFSVLAFVLAFSERRSTITRLAMFFLAILLGLLTHRLMALGLCSIGLARCFARKPNSVPLWGLVVSGGLAVAGFLPWLSAFAQQATKARFEHQDSVGGYHLSMRLVNELVALPSRLVTPFLRELGPGWAALEIVASGSFALVLCALFFQAWRGRRARPAEPVLRGLWSFAFVQFLITTLFAVWTWDRVPLQYYTPMAWAIPLLVAATLDRVGEARAAKWFSYALALLSLLMGIGLVGGKSREDMRGGIAAVRAFADEARIASGLEPVFSAVLAQPPQFEHTLPYLAYAPELKAIEPQDVARPGSAEFERPLIVLRRNLALNHALWSPITTGRKQVRKQIVDRYLTVYWFGPALGK